MDDGKRLGWVGTSKKDLMDLPKKIRKMIGYSLHLEYEESSGNVFAALGFENPEEDLAKANLVAEISHIIKKKRLTQVKVANILGVNQPRVSSLLSGNLDLFSIEMLMNFLKILGQDIEIVIMPKPKNRKQAHLSVVSSGERSSVPLAAKCS